VLLDADTFGNWFVEFQRSAWRYERQPAYAMPREQDNLRRWRDGEPKPDEHNARGHERVRGIVAAGKSVGRVRVVGRPLTEYQRHQLEWAIPGNVEAGEDIRILDITNLDLDLPTQDFWLFDDATVVDLNFAPDGSLVNRDQRDGQDLTRYRRWRDLALAHAVPLSEWNART
jgi:hypothetical protein